MTIKRGQRATINPYDDYMDINSRGARSNIITTVFKCYTCGCEFIKTIDVTKEYPLQCDNCESLENTNKEN